MKLFIFIFLLSQITIAQIKVGTYKIVSDSLRTPELILKNDQTFSYSNRNGVSCLVWYQTDGTWKVNFDKLILIDSVMGFDREITKTTYLKRTTIYSIENENLHFYKQYWETSKSEYNAAKPIFGDLVFKE